MSASALFAQTPPRLRRAAALTPSVHGLRCPRLARAAWAPCGAGACVHCPAPGLAARGGRRLKRGGSFFSSQLCALQPGTCRWVPDCTCWQWCCLAGLLGALCCHAQAIGRRPPPASRLATYRSRVGHPAFTCADLLPLDSSGPCPWLAAAAGRPAAGARQGKAGHIAVRTSARASTEAEGRPRAAPRLAQKATPKASSAHWLREVGRRRAGEGCRRRGAAAVPGVRWGRAPWQCLGAGASGHLCLRVASSSQCSHNINDSAAAVPEQWPRALCSRPHLHASARSRSARNRAGTRGPCSVDSPVLRGARSSTGASWRGDWRELSSAHERSRHHGTDVGRARGDPFPRAKLASRKGGHGGEAGPVRCGAVQEEGERGRRGGGVVRDEMATSFYKNYNKSILHEKIYINSAAETGGMPRLDATPRHATQHTPSPHTPFVPRQSKGAASR